MKSILVIGGTRFFGKKLVSMLLKDGYRVTIATRGQAEDSFGDSVQRIVLDRTERDSLQQGIGSTEWDLVYDQICYSPDDAKAACDIFKGRVGQYILTSTGSVYDFEESLKEEAFDPCSYPVRMGPRESFDYAEGKRLTEAVFFQKKSFPLAAVRFPIIVGRDDYTERLLFHVRRIHEGKPIYFPNIDARISLMSSDDASQFLAWMGENFTEGSINAFSGNIVLRKLVSIIEECVGRKAVLSSTSTEESFSPYGFEKSFTMSSQKASDLGFEARTDIRELIRSLCSC